jgi:YHS domain-containing protein
MRFITNTTGSHNTAIGESAGYFIPPPGDYNIYVGAGAGLHSSAGENNAIRIGDNLPETSGASACYIGGIFNQTAFSAAVFVDSGGHLGTQTSSKRFKEDIAPVNAASEALFGLQPVTFRYKKSIDPARRRQFGLVAEEVEKVDPDLVMRDNQGKPYSVRYDAVNAMLLNEFLKEHRAVQELQATVAEQQKSFESKFVQQQKQIGALTAGLQKVSAQMELSKPAAQTVLQTEGHPVCPVCGMDVDPATAPKSDYKGKIYYFGSQGHKEQFDANPDQFVQADKKR